MKLQLNNIIHNSAKMDVTSLITEESSLRLKVACPKCDSSYIVKNGKNALNDQRYKCKSCGRIFSTHTNSPMSYSKKSKVQWLKYVECMRQGLSIRESAKIVKIHKNTAFYWRHKILNALKEKLSEKLEGVISIDELYINESYKGNHSKNKCFTLGRASIKRGLYGYNRFAQPKICILCCKDKNDGVFSRAISKGMPNFNEVNDLLKDRIPKGSVLYTNKNMAYQSFAARKKLKIYRDIINKNMWNVRANLQEVKAFGVGFKNFIKKFKGVATKYINFYITWYKVLHLMKQSLPHKVKDILIYLDSSRKRLRVCDFKHVKSLN